MDKQLPAKLISYIFDPVVVILFGVFTLSQTLSLANQVGALIFLSLGGLLPAATAFYEYYNTKVNRVITRIERNEVYISGLIGFSFLVALFSSETYRSDYWMFLSMATAVYFGLTLGINYIFDKPSQHMGVFAFWTMILVDRVSTGYGLLLALLLVVAWARLELKVHTWSQIFWGLSVGLLAGLMTWPFW